MEHSIRVTAPAGDDYNIHIANGVLNEIRNHLQTPKAAIITNTTLASIYRDSLAKILPETPLAIMTDGEQFKTLDTVARLYVDLVDAGMDRASTVIAFGGGVVGDTAGFVAATYMRGIRLMQIPTSLLSMVDSSVGGKVGVDLPQGKNLVGAFKQPDCVLVDPLVLRTLPDREWRCGMAEVIKHGLIADPELLDSTLWSKDHAAELVRRAMQVKVDIVQQDPYEHGIRAYLNLGHTFAHAVERVSDYKWLHGEAVGVGLVAAARLSHALGLCDSGLAEEVEDLVNQIGLPTRLDNLDPDALFAAMSTDKKWQAGHSRFVLLRGMCQPAIIEDVPKMAVLRILQELIG